MKKIAAGRQNICGTRVKAARRDFVRLHHQKMTQSDLAARMQIAGCDIERLAICRIERGLRPVSDIELVHLAAALEVSVDYLLTGNGSETASSKQAAQSR